MWCTLQHSAVEAHSWADGSTGNRFLSRTQLLMINQMQDNSTRRSLSTAYRVCNTVDKDLQVEATCSGFIIEICVLLRNLLPVVCCSIPSHDTVCKRHLALGTAWYISLRTWDSMQIPQPHHYTLDKFLTWST